MIDCYCSEIQYSHHVLPLWLALNPSERGTFYGSSIVAVHLAARGVGVQRGYPQRGDPPVIVASWQDHRAAASRGRATIYVEHGAGQTYIAEPGARGHLSYSGSDGHEDCQLFLCPSETVADRWRARYPFTPAVAVGAPSLDRWHLGRAREGQDCTPVVAVSFHAEVEFVPETMGAFRHYKPGLPAFVMAAVERGWRVIGHGHPRLWKRIEPWWRKLGVEPVREWADVLDLLTAEPSCYVADNSSTLPEAASCGAPLVWLSAPWFRRNVEHGGRFWEWPRGQVQCDGPDELVAAVELALVDPPDVRAAREATVASVYAACDGRATERAVAAIRRLAR